MPSLADLKCDENIVAMAVGKGGCGKSTALASLPKPIYFFDIDQRLKGVIGSTIISDEEKRQIDYDFYDYKFGFKKIDDMFYYFSEQYDKRMLKYKTIIVESADQLFEMLLIDSIRIKGGSIQDLSKLKGDEKKGLHIVGNVTIATPDDYKYVYAAFRKLFYNYFKYFHKCNVILSAGTTPVWGKAEGESNPYAPEVIKGRRIYAPQGLADLLPRMFDEIWEFDKEEPAGKNGKLKYTVQFRSDIAKTCFVKLPNQIDITGKNFYNELKKYIPLVGEPAGEPEEKEKEKEKVNVL